MEKLSFLTRETELNAINVVQGAWVVERERVLRTILGSCVAVCLFDPVARVGGMNHYVYPPRPSTGSQSAGATTLYGDLCMEGLFNAVLASGASRARLRAKAFGASAMFGQESEFLSAGKRNSSYAKYWLEKESIPLDLFDFHGAYARKLIFHPASGQHLCHHFPATFNLSVKR